MRYADIFKPVKRDVIDGYVENFMQHFCMNNASIAEAPGPVNARIAALPEPAG